MFEMYVPGGELRFYSTAAEKKLISGQKKKATLIKFASSKYNVILKNVA